MSLKEIYKKEVILKMKKRFGYKNDLAVPKLTKVIVNIGTGPALKDPKLLNIMVESMKKIIGQIPIKRQAKKAISGFGIREGMIVGLQVTLREKQMYNFLDKLANVVLPRIRDFKGLDPKKFDGYGNYTLGIKEHTVFPEIKTEDVEKIHGLEVTIVTSAKSNEEAKELLKLLGFPFKE